MKKRNIKLVTFGFAAMLLASCSDSNDTLNPTPNPAETGIIGKEVTSITDAQQLAARVYNFKRPSTTRAAGVTSANLNQAYTMEAEPNRIGLCQNGKNVQPPAMEFSCKHRYVYCSRRNHRFKQLPS